MPSSKKPPKPRRSRGSRVTRRHPAPPADPPPPPAPEPDPQGATVPVMVGGIRIADLILAPAANLPASAHISATLSELRGWLVLGAEIAANGLMDFALAKGVVRHRDNVFREFAPDEDPRRGGES